MNYLKDKLSFAFCLELLKLLKQWQTLNAILLSLLELLLCMWNVFFVNSFCSNKMIKFWFYKTKEW